MKRFFLPLLIVAFCGVFISLDAQPLAFNIESKVVNCEDNTVELNLTVDEFTDITSFQFALAWDTSLLEYDHVTNNLPPASIILLNNPGGELKISWFHLTVFPTLPGYSVSNGTTILTLHFNILGPGGTSTPIAFTGLPSFVLEVGGIGGAIIPNNQIDFNDGMVTIFDDEAPVFTVCPADILVNILPPATQTIVNWTAPTATDNCQIPNITSNFSPGQAFPLGTTEVQYIAADSAGNRDTCTFNVTVMQDSNADKLRFEADSKTVDCSANTVDVDVKVFNFDTIQSFQYGFVWDTSVLKYNTSFNFLPPTGIINVSSANGGQLGVFWSDFSLPPGESLSDGTTIFRVRFNVTGDGGDSTFVKFMSTMNAVIEVAKPNGVLDTTDYVLTNGLVKITDNQAPVISGCPSDLSVLVLPGNTQTAVNWTAPSATDNCNLIDFSSNFSPGDIFPVGTTTVNYTAEDAAGNISACSFDVVVMEDPNAGKPNFIIEEVNTDCDASTVTVEVSVINFDSITAMDFAVMWDTSVLDYSTHTNFLPPTPLYLSNNTANGTLGLSWVTFTIPPFISLPDSTVIFSLTFDVKGTSGDTSLIKFINLSAPEIEIAKNGNLLDPNTEVIFQNGVVRVQDFEAPVFQNCPGNLILNASGNFCGIDVTWDSLTAIDNCDPNVVITQLSVLGRGDFFPVGISQVMYVATDGDGNQDTCAFTVTVNDMEAPVFTGCPSDIIIVLPTDSCNTTADWIPPTATDNCTPVNLTSNFNPGDNFPTDTTEVVYTAADTFGNVSTCTFLVIIQDNQSPVIVDCPADITLVAEADSCSALASWDVPTFSDNCSGATMTSNFSPGDRFPVDTTEVIYIATDPSGNADTCSFLVIVSDDQAPVIADCPGDITLSMETDSCDVAAMWNPPTASDNCSVIMTSNFSPGDRFAADTTEVIYIATDPSGNADTCSFLVIVTDDQAPVITCSSDIIITLSQGATDTILNGLTPSVVENCTLDTVYYELSGATTGSGADDASGTNFSAGATTVTYYAVDASGNADTCSFQVVVSPGGAITFNCPANVDVEQDNGTCRAIVNNIPLVILTNQANVDSVTYELSGATTGSGVADASGTEFNVGTTTVLYKIFDVFGDSLECTFTVLVRDTELPVISNCPADIVVNGNCDAAVNWSAPLASDNCQIDALTASHQPNSVFSQGVTVVTYTARDLSGNETSCSFTVTVNDVIPPTLIGCPGNLVFNTDPDSCTAMVTWDPPVAVDTCSPPTTMSVNIPPDSRLPVGQYVVIYVSADAVGNTDTCRFNVTVRDNQRPAVINCPANVEVSATPGLCSAPATWTSPVFSDNCGIVSIDSTNSSGDIFPLGMTMVRYVAFDANMNSDTCEFLVTVRDDEFPDIQNCPADITVDAHPDSCGARVSWTPPVVTDNCTVSGVSSTANPGDIFPIGTTSVVYTVTDPSGNVNVCRFEITVRDTTGPSINCPGDIELLVDGTIVSDPGQFLLSAITDNCTGAILFFDPPQGTDGCGSPVVVTRNDNTGLNSGDVFPVGMTELIYLVSDTSGNTVECSININILPINNSVSANASPNNLCEGGDVQLTANFNFPNADFRWTGPDNFVSNMQNPLLQDVMVADSGIYTVVVTTLNGCRDTASVLLTVFKNPELVIMHNDIICTDGNTDLEFTADDLANTNIVTWSWTGPINFSSNLQNPVIQDFNPVQSGIYRLTAINSNGCSDSTSVNIQSSSPITPTLVPIGNDYQYCTNETATLLGTQYNSNNVQYNWAVNPDNGVVWTPANNNSLAMTFNEPGDFEVSFWAIVDGCSSDTATVTLHVDAPPQLDISSNAPLLCTQGNDTLRLFEANGQADTYQWSGPLGFGSNMQNPTIANVTASNSGLYILTAITGDNCRSEESINIQITNGPTPLTPIVEPVDTNLCLGASLDLVGQQYFNINGVVYKWVATPGIGSGLPNVSNNSSISVTPTVAGNYSFSFHAEVAGCSTDTVAVTVSVTDKPAIDLNYNDPLTCITGSTNLELSESGGNAVSWQWTGPNSFSSDVQNPVISGVSISNSGTYNVSITDINGCTNAGSIDVSITEGLAQLTIDVNKMRHCELADTLILEVALIPGATYFWSGPVQLSSTGNRILIVDPSAAYSGAYTVFARNNDGCESPVSDTAFVEILEAPETINDLINIIIGSSDTFNVLLNDTFNPLEPFEITIVSPPQNGTIEDLKDGRFVYTPNGNSPTQDFFTYEICYDSCALLCDKAVVTLNIDYDPNECVIPSVITPNDDGKNDFFVISCIEAGTFPDNEIIIFNEWGDEVFRADPYQNDWDGTYKGNPLPDGTYYYIFTRSPNAKAVKGFITIFR